MKKKGGTFPILLLFPVLGNYMQHPWRHWFSNVFVAQKLINFILHMSDLLQEMLHIKFYLLKTCFYDI